MIVCDLFIYLEIMYEGNLKIWDILFDFLYLLIWYF